MTTIEWCLLILAVLFGPVSLCLTAWTFLRLPSEVQTYAVIPPWRLVLNIIGTIICIVYFCKWVF